MKQLLQRLDSGLTEIVDVPVPTLTTGEVLVRTKASVVSVGTERMLVQFGRSSLIQKARSQPDRVREVLAKMRTDGIGPTIAAVRSKLGEPIPLGYCNAGVVEEVGQGVPGFLPGQRVVTNGPHAEFVAVKHMLAAPIPDGVEFSSAAFTPLAAIALQGVRLANPTLGETVVVFGLGVIGLLAVQLLRANGCRVVGVDIDEKKLALGSDFGADVVNGNSPGLVERVKALTAAEGADAVLMTLATKSDGPMHQAAGMCRQRGRIVLVGVTGLHLSRDDFYRKELSFSVSCSYGPGRYDPSYEEKGTDYPLGFVRWTEQRNFMAVLEMMARGTLDPAPLVAKSFPFDDAPDAYQLVAGGDDSLGLVLTYPEAPETKGGDGRTVQFKARTEGRAGVVGVIGAGNYAQRTLLPILAKLGVGLKGVASMGGTSAALAATKFGFEYATSDPQEVLDDGGIDTVFVLTRHDSHADLAERALRAGKNVFVEKPLALSLEDLESVRNAANHGSGLLTVGFNRRSAPMTQRLRALLQGRRGPLTLVITVNAGALPRDHWTHDPQAGGGRIVGEACHFIDLARNLTGHSISTVNTSLARGPDGAPVTDQAIISLLFSDGSTAAVNYLSNGPRGFPKERIEAFWEGEAAVIDNWRALWSYSGGRARRVAKGRQDKGHADFAAGWIAAVKGGADSPIALEEVIEVSAASIRAASLQ